MILWLSTIFLLLISCTWCRGQLSPRTNTSSFYASILRVGNVQSQRFEDLHVRVYGEAGIVNGAVIETTDHGERKILFTDVFAYRDGKWRAVSAQELPVAAP